MTGTERFEESDYQKDCCERISHRSNFVNKTEECHCQ